MITINVFLTVKPEKKAEYLAFVKELVAASREDAGCLFYSHFSDLYDENKFVIVENWADQAAIDLHNQTPHLKSFVENIPTMAEFELKISH